jgi:hypothetical protein
MNNRGKKKEKINNGKIRESREVSWKINNNTTKILINIIKIAPNPKKLLSLLFLFANFK